MYSKGVAANQKTITAVISYDWKNFGFPGLTTNLISAQVSGIYLDQMRENGDLGYYLSGKKKFHATLMDLTYAWKTGPLEGLSARVVGGLETNQASLQGMGIFLTYDLAIF